MLVFESLEADCYSRHVILYNVSLLLSLNKPTSLTRSVAFPLATHRPRLSGRSWGRCGWPRCGSRWGRGGRRGRGAGWGRSDASHGLYILGFCQRLCQPKLCPAKTTGCVPPQEGGGDEEADEDEDKPLSSHPDADTTIIFTTGEGRCGSWSVFYSLFLMHQTESVCGVCVLQFQSFPPMRLSSSWLGSPTRAVRTSLSSLWRLPSVTLKTSSFTFRTWVWSVTQY